MATRLPNGDVLMHVIADFVAPDGSRIEGHGVMPDERVALTLADARAFHANFYRPDNATLIVSGNFDQAQLDAWVDRYFANIKKPERTIPRVTAVEPARTEARDYTVREPNVPLPAVAITWQGPAASDKDTAALTVLDAILSGGKSSPDAVKLRRSENQTAASIGDSPRTSCRYCAMNRKYPTTTKMPRRYVPSDALKA